MGYVTTNGGGVITPLPGSLFRSDLNDPRKRRPMTQVLSCRASTFGCR